jgi:hypothetical protein
MIRLIPLRGFRLRYLVRPPVLLTAAWAGTIAILEVLGRRSPSDAFDALGVAALLLLSLATVAMHRARRIAWVEHLMMGGSHVARTLVSRMLRIGVDLRGAPPLQRRFPVVLSASLLACAPAAGIVVALRGWLPGGARDVLLATSSTIYFVLLGLLWGVLLAVSLFLLVFTGACLHNWMVNFPGVDRGRRVRVELGVMMGIFVGLVALGLLLPLWVPLSAMGITLFLTMLAVGIPGAPQLLLVWQERRGGAIAVTPWTWVLACAALLAATGLGVLVLLAVGDRIAAGVMSTNMPITSFLGSAVAWTGALAYASWAWSFPLKTFVHRFRDPARPSPIRVNVDSTRQIVGPRVDHLRAAGFDVSLASDETEHPGDVSLKLDRQALRPELPGHFELPVAGQIRVHPDDLDHPDVHDAIYHVHEVACRHLLISGLEELFRFAAGRRFEHGHGFWIAPHLWFVTHMTRDTSEDDSWSVGLPYHRVLPHGARHHLYRVMRALEIDLIFLEDGVRFEQLRLVFRAMFDIFDFFGGGRAEEQHFHGLPGLRVMIHDFTMERPFREKGYPDVNYEEIGRARILHVFRDRGGPDESSDVPVDSDLLGEPALV